MSGWERRRPALGGQEQPHQGKHQKDFHVYIFLLASIEVRSLFDFDVDPLRHRAISPERADDPIRPVPSSTVFKHQDDPMLPGSRLKPRRENMLRVEVFPDRADLPVADRNQSMVFLVINAAVWQFAIGLDLDGRFAVLGCGVIGLSTARLLQRRGAAVTIYAKSKHARLG